MLVVGAGETLAFTLESQINTRATAYYFLVVRAGETPAFTLESQINTKATAYFIKTDPQYRGSRAENER